MSTKRIIERNRANANKSTGPLTKVGKALVAQNARKHGATAKPDSARVATMMRIILDDPRLAFEDVDLGSDVLRRAFVLAEAEVRLAHCEKVYEETSRFDHRIPLPLIEGYEVYQDLSEHVASNPDYGVTRLSYISSYGFGELRVRGDRTALARRYWREALSARNKAFKAWLEYLARERGRAAPVRRARA